MVGSKGILKDRDGAQVQLENDNIYDGDPSDNVVEMDLNHKIKLNPDDLKIMYQKDNEYKNIKLLFSFALEPPEDQEDDEDFEEDYGWGAVKIFDDKGVFKKGQMEIDIYVPPIG